uniref:Single Kunitz protease inhibitor n=1 Tax=Anopheles funestus TaxID=62324 RepID=A0A4Y0BH28_ANOFN
MWPWHATITHRTRNELKVVCGGSIIDKYTILTAAHCLYTEHGVITTNRVIVHVGQSKLFTIDSHTRAYFPEKFLIHPGHRESSLKDDIALIRLGTEIEMSDYVQPVCVCAAEDDAQIVGRYGTVIGFGLNINGTMSDHLLEAEVPIVHRWECLESNRDDFGKHLTGKMLCAGKRNAVGPCNGDSGGGFVFNNDGVWCVRGIVSFTSALNDTNICDPQQYVVYTDVAKYIDWLHERIRCEDGELCEAKPTESPQMACHLRKDKGSCTNFTVVHFFDIEYGGCGRFWYGGCEGNNNRFDTELECKNTCVTPSGRDICLLPKSEGPCTGVGHRWYYNLELKTCQQFLYGGCLGNSNRFESFEDCSSVCSQDNPS